MSSPEERFTVGCPRCGKRYVVTPSAIGKKATCKCGRSFLVEKPPEDEDDDDGAIYDIQPPASDAPAPAPADAKASEPRSP